jgi:DNA-3-methyladenine glycosylase II
MWYPKSNGRPDWSPALKFLRRDPILKPIIARVGECKLSPRRDYFIKLCQSIFSQQLSTTVAAVMFKRFAGLFPRNKPTPQQLLALSDEQLRTTGVSRPKLKYLRDLAGKFCDGTINCRSLVRLEDEAIIENLTQVNGIGRWTVEMFLIFALNRPDVWPIDDLGIRKGVQRVHKLKEIPQKEQMLELGEKWKPWRSVASWYLWRSG